jgi:2-oxoglutarate dehydrogenase E2 component (dihydrolipoamide succinyltransferase)
MSTFRMEPRWVRVGKERRADLRALIVVATMLVLFGASFAIGRVTSAGRAGHAEAQSSVGVAPAAAAVPIRLSSTPPLPLDALIRPPAPAPQKAQPASAPAPAAPAQPAAVAAEPAATEAPVPAPTQPAAPEAAPSAPAPAPSSGGGHSKPSSGGGSFESSG